MKSAFSDDYGKFVECLIKARKQSGFTQYDVAERIGKPQSFVSKYERRERRLDVIEFLQIARAIGADPYELLRQVEKEHRRLRRTVS